MGNAGASASGKAINGTAKLSADAAQKLIVKDGYSNVQNLKANADGSFSGVAKRGSQAVNVKVGSNGRVSAQ
jgi:hypothetical protein